MTSSLSGGCSRSIDVVADHISHPFRLLPTGEIATVDEDSDAAYAEELAVLLLTRQGERQLVPGFGTVDPVGSGIDVADLSAKVDTYGPPVTVTRVVGEATSPTVEAVTVEFDRNAEVD